MNKSKIVTGKYGEQLIFTKLKNNRYIFTCLEINRIDKYIDKNEYEKLINKYCYVGEPNFNKQNRNEVISRARNLGIVLINTYLRYAKTKDKGFHKEIEDILQCAKAFELNDKDFIDLFLTAGSTVSNVMKVCTKDRQIKTFFKFMKKYISVSQFEYLKNIKY